MKKMIIFTSAFALVIAAGASLMLSYAKIDPESLLSRNIEALARREDNPEQDGPGQMVECGGIFNAKQKKVCMAYLPDTSCYESECF